MPPVLAEEQRDSLRALLQEETDACHVRMSLTIHDEALRAASREKSSEALRKLVEASKIATPQALLRLAPAAYGDGLAVYLEHDD